MEKAVSVARDDLSSIRTGRANPGMFNRINIDYYGSMTPDHAAVQHQRARGAARRHQALRGEPAAPHRGRDPQLRPRRQPEQRRQRHPDLDPAADRGAPPRPGQAGQGQGRGRQGVGAQHPPQGDGGARPHQEGRRGRRGRGRPRREGPRQEHPARTPARSTNWSSTKKASCWRSRSSDRPSATALPWQTPRPVDDAEPRSHEARRRAGRNLPAAIAVGAFLGFGVIAILVFAPLRLGPGRGGRDGGRHPRGGAAAARRRATRSRSSRCSSAVRR